MLTFCLNISFHSQFSIIRGSLSVSGTLSQVNGCNFFINASSAFVHSIFEVVPMYCVVVVFSIKMMNIEPFGSSVSIDTPGEKNADLHIYSFI